MIYLKRHWKDIIIVFLIAVIACFGYYIYNQHQNVPMQTIADTTPASIATAQKQEGKFQSNDDAKEVSGLIQERTQKPADIVFYTNTQKEADAKANELAKKDGSDYLLKQTETKVYTDSTPVNNNNQVKTSIENKYYSITQDKKNQINVGVTVIEKNVYLTAGYQHDKLSLYVHSKDLKTIEGATVLYTIKKW